MGIRKLGLILGGVALLIGCAKDRTAEQDQRDKALQKMAQYQAVAGHYTGIVSSAANGQVMTAIALTLHARQTSVNGVESAALDVTLEFQDYHYLKINGTNIGFDTDTGSIHSEFAITRKDGSVASLSLMGSVGAGAFAGSIHGVDDTSKREGNFSLRLDGPELSDLAEPLNKARDPDEGRTAVFKGYGHMNEEPDHEMKFTSIYAVLKDEDHYVKDVLTKSSRSR